MRTLKQIRSTFLDYFVKQGHTHVASSPLVPQNDPTLMFTAAGMVQFKDLFTGNETRDYTRAVTSQKCLRAGGKHNDLDNVGYTARHHTFFEMLGNFSFGDYFKEDAIRFAYEMVTKEFALPQDRLLVTVYADDDEAAQLWKKIGGFSEDKIIRIATSDNFWSMGDTGPCGPCSEIFFDHGDHIAGGPPGSPDEDGDRFIEIWNLVFMQFEQMADGSRIALPKPSIDTGMGLERLASVLQGKHNNFDIDIFEALIDSSRALTGNVDSALRQSHNVIADHFRACSFLIADGVLPSNEGRGYVLRRILRRALRHAHILGAKQPVLSQMVPTLVGLMGETFPELCRAKSLIEQTLSLEEERFHQTLDRGLKVLRDETQKLAPLQELPGEVAFRLYDTYGFPLDLTQDVLRAESRAVDCDGFETHMQDQKKRARAAWVGSGDEACETIWHELRESVGATDFLGYTTCTAEGVVNAIVKDGTHHKEAQYGDDIWVVLNQTPFYAESGGQVGDQGVLVNEDVHLDVSDCLKKAGAVFVHKAKVVKGTLKVGMALKAHVNQEVRSQTAANHSATHLLQSALRNVLGEHVCQKGSLVDATRLRFDFTHTKAVTADEMLQVEQMVNAEILKNHQTRVTLSTPDQAIAQGALALFGEKYGDEVRVVAFGSGECGAVQVSNQNFSVELCGGIHVKSTGEIGLFKIISEGSVAAGVRRIEAVTGQGVLQHIQQLTQEVASLKEQNKKAITDGAKVAQALRAQIAMLKCQGAHTLAEKVADVSFVYLPVVDIAPKDLKAMAEMVLSQLEMGIVVVASHIEGKVSLVIAVGSELIGRYNAVDFIKAASTHLGGKGGGGKPELAQGGGDQVQNLPALKALLMSLLN